MKITVNYDDDDDDDFWDDPQVIKAATEFQYSMLVLLILTMIFALCLALRVI